MTGWSWTDLVGPAGRLLPRLRGKPPAGHSGGAPRQASGIARPGRRRWLVAALALTLVLSVGEWLLAQPARPPTLGVIAAADAQGLVVRAAAPWGVAWRKGVRAGDRVTAVDGLAIQPGSSPALLDGATSAATRARRGGRVTLTSIAEELGPEGRPPPAILLLTAAAELVVGLATFLLAGQVAAPALVLAATASGAVSFVAGIPEPTPGIHLLRTSLADVSLLAGFALYLIFPRNLLRFWPGRLALVASSIVVVGIAGLRAYALLVAPTLWELAHSLWLVEIPVLLVARLSILTGLGIWSRRRAPPVFAEVMLLGLTVAVGLLPNGLSFLPYVLGVGFLVPTAYTVPIMAVPVVGFGAVVLSRHDLGIERVVRRSLVALFVWGLLVIVYIVVAQLLEAQVGRLPWAVAVVVTAATFAPVQHALRLLVERSLFGEVSDYAETLRTLSHELVDAPGSAATIRYFLERLGSRLGVAWAALHLGEAGSPPAFRWEMPDRSGAGRQPTRELRLAVGQSPVGTLLLGPKRRGLDFSAEDERLLATIGPLVASSVRNALLVDELAAQVGTLAARERELQALSVRLISAEEETRRAVALEIHDDPLQRLALLMRSLDDAQRLAGAGGSDHATEWLRSELAQVALTLRGICHDLRPAVLDDLGLVAALRQLVAETEVRAAPLEVALAVSPAQLGPLPPGLDLALYRVAQEGLTNCIKHAQARQVAVSLDCAAGSIRLSIADDGQGPPATVQPGLGLTGMRERLRPWSGEVSLERSPQGGAVLWAEVKA